MDGLSRVGCAWPLREQPGNVLGKLTDPVRPVRIVLAALIGGTRMVVLYVNDAKSLLLRRHKGRRSPAPTQLRVQPDDVRQKRTVHQEGSVRIVTGGTDHVAAQVIEHTFRILLHRWKCLEGRTGSARENDASVVTFDRARDKVGEPVDEKLLFIGFDVENVRSGEDGGEIEARLDLSNQSFVRWDDDPDAREVPKGVREVRVGPSVGNCDWITTLGEPGKRAEKTSLVFARLRPRDGAYGECVGTRMRLRRSGQEAK